MSDEPSLPRIPPSKAVDAVFGPARKRARFDLRRDIQAHLLANSSDPAVFSGDDDPALDDYGADRRKKKKYYVGSWDAQHPASTDSTFDESDSAGRPGLPGQPGQAGRSEVSDGSTLARPPSPARPQSQKRTFQRQYDSGVFMGSGGDAVDSSDTADMPAAADAAAADDVYSAMAASSPPPPAYLQPVELPADFPPPPPRQRRVFQRVPSLAVSAAEARARDIVQECVEQGNEKINLMGLRLDKLSNATVEPLSGLVPIPHVAANVAFLPRDPALEVYLSNNQLSRLPGALFSLEYLTILTLRNNGLTELPPAIGQLRNLQSLTVSLNALRYLPAELLGLMRCSGKGGKLKELFSHPNPFFEPDNTTTHDPSERREGGSRAPAQSAQYTSDRLVARSRVRYLDSTGRVWSDFVPTSTMLGTTAGTHTTTEPEPEPVAETRTSLHYETRILTEDLAVVPRAPWSTLPHVQDTSAGASDFGSIDKAAATAAPVKPSLTASRVPTLMELALVSCYDVPRLQELPEMLPPDAPAHLTRQLTRMLAVREAGGVSCSVCARRPLAAPMTEWLEWWDIGMRYKGQLSAGGQNNRLPFLFRGCSWGCVPSARFQCSSETTPKINQDGGGAPMGSGS